MVLEGALLDSVGLLIPIIIGVIFTPESPWWLVRKGRSEDAKQALLSLTSKTDTSYNVDDTLAMMVHTNE